MLTKTPQATQLPITLSNDFQFSNLIFKKLTIPTGKKQTKQNPTHFSSYPGTLAYAKAPTVYIKY